MFPWCLQISFFKNVSYSLGLYIIHSDILMITDILFTCWCYETSHHRRYSSRSTRLQPGVKTSLCGTKQIYLMNVSKEKRRRKKRSSLHACTFEFLALNAVKLNFLKMHSVLNLYCVWTSFCLCLQAVEDGCYLCEETIVVYCLDDPPKEDSFSLIHSTVYYCDRMTQKQSHSGKYTVSVTSQ